MARLTPRGRRQVLLVVFLSLLVPAAFIGCVLRWYTGPDCGWGFCVEPKMREIVDESLAPASATEIWSEFSGSTHDDSVLTVAYRVRRADDEVRPSPGWRWVDDPDGDWGSGWRSGDCAVLIAAPGDDGYIAPGGQERMRVPERTFVVYVTCPWNVE